jgi:hypothetical protein
MSERTAASLAKFDELFPVLKTLSASPAHDRLIDDAEALRRAIASFHMEAIRFRMHNVDRALREAGDDAAARAAFEQLRHALEEAGFQTRSQAAP